MQRRRREAEEEKYIKKERGYTVDICWCFTDTGSRKEEIGGRIKKLERKREDTKLIL